MSISAFIHWWQAKHHPRVECQIVENDGHCQNLVLDSFPAVVGRSTEADLQLSDRWVSRMHCVLTLDEDGLTVRDLESHNGTSVNCETIRGPQILNVHDVIQVGFTQIVVMSCEA